MPFGILTSSTAPPLERALLDRIDRLLHGGDGAPARTAIVVAPTGRLLVRIRRLLLEEDRTYWGLHLLHHRALAEAIVRTAGDVPLRVLRTREQRALLAEVLANGAGDGLPREVTLPGSGALAALHATLRDLRDSAIGAGEAADALAGVEATGPVPPSEISRVFGEYGRALTVLESRGAGDAASLSAQAERLVPRSGIVERSEGLAHYGAYDVLGIHRKLLAALAMRLDVTLLVPGIGAGPAFEHARGALARWVGEEEASNAESLPDGGTGEIRCAFADRLDALYDGLGEFPIPNAVSGADRERLEVVSVAGDEAELVAAAKRVLSWHGDGTESPLHETAIIARSLEPYAARLEGVLRTDHGLPFTTSAKHPLRRDPAVRAFRDLLEALADEFPARALMSYLRSPAARLDGIVGGPSARAGDRPPCPSRWERLARRAGIARSREAWTEDLPEWARDRVECAARDAATQGAGEASGRQAERHARSDLSECESLAAVVDGLSASAAEWQRRDTWAGHAGFLMELARERLAPTRHGGEGHSGGEGDEVEDGNDSARARRSLEGVLNALRFRDELPIAAGRPDNGRDARRGRPVEVGEALRAVGEAIEAELLPMAPAQGPGVAVLDAMQARGLSFRNVIWIGLNSGMQPLRPRPDPFLPDELRRLLRERTGALVPVKDEAVGEERLLAALTLGAARERLVLSWQRADGSGRGRAASSVVRELARALAGRAESRALLGGESERVVRATLVPMHPALEAERETVGGTGLVSWRDAAACVAARGDDPASAIGALPPTTDGDVVPEAGAIAHAVAIGGFNPGDLSADGTVGPVVETPSAWSPSRLETLGRCPLRYFFRYALRIFGEEPPPEEHLVEPAEIGLAVHAALHALVGEWADEEGRISFPGEPGQPRDDEITRLRARAAELFRDATASSARRVSRRYPALWQATEQAWVEALARTAIAELSRLSRENARVSGREMRLSAEIEVTARGEPGSDRVVRVEGRIDRLDELSDASLRVVDYKTGRSATDLVDRTLILKGDRLQMELYRQLAAQSRSAVPAPVPAVARVVPIRPDLEPSDPGGESDLTVDLSSHGKGPELLESFRDTLGTLLRLAEDGRFPLNEKGPCDWCEFDPACRRTHPASVDRVHAAPSYRDYYRIKAKGVRKPWPEEGEDG